MRFFSSPIPLLLLILLEISPGEGQSDESVRRPNTLTRGLASDATNDTSATATSSKRQLGLLKKIFGGADVTESATEDSNEFQAIRINCGARTDYTDGSGRKWQEDNYYSDGTGTLIRPNESIKKVYQSMRKSGGSSMSYDIPVPEGDYTVALHFAELFYSEIGKRTFAVTVEGIVVSQSWDIFEEAGAITTPVIKRRRVQVSDGFLTIRLDPIIENVVISAIEVFKTNPPPTDATGPNPPQPTSPQPTPPQPTSPQPTPSPPTPPSNPPPTSPQPTPSPPTPPSNPPPTLIEKSSFKPVLINAGGPEYTDLFGRMWKADSNFIGGKTYSKTRDISDTQDDFLYTSERYGSSFSYEFDLPVGNYELIFHFAEIYLGKAGERVFSIKTQSQIAFDSVDILVLTSGQKNEAVTLETTEVVSDGVLLIEFVTSTANYPKVCGIEINLIAPHLAHAVANGPYTAVDTNDDGKALVPVDASQSHTHGSGLRLIEWIWKVDNQVVGTGEVIDLVLPVGEHVVTLFVVDNGGNDSYESTTISVYSSGFPVIDSLSPDQGSIAGGDQITIIGSGFKYSAAKTIVHIGDLQLSGEDIAIDSPTTITVLSPVAALATPAPVVVETPLGKSNAMYFTYIDGSPIEFTSEKVTDIYSPTTVEFGPDGKLYIGTSDGIIVKLTLDANFNVVESMASSVLDDLPGGHRTITGITFDPMDTSENPAVYVSHSFMFHGETSSSSGDAINGKISIISGGNLDKLEDVVTGLPVADHDHSVNQIEFGDFGQLFIQVGGSTNAGVPGRLTGKGVQKDNVLSSATLVAYLSDPNFNGHLTYDADDDGNLNPGFGVEVFAAGNRNPFDIVLHSNGFLYGTDNGPNLNYGARLMGCNGDAPDEELPEIEEEDKINLIKKGAYYGHPNRKRGETDPRQCVWHSQTESSTDDYTAPIVIAPSSADGIIEFQTDHFGGQLRGNLIYSKYKKPLYRVILTADGTGVLPQSVPPIELIGNVGLDVTQAPDGRLVEARYQGGSVFSYKPVEASTSKLIVKGVFPRRGGEAGGSKLAIYGVNLNNNSNGLAVTVGGSECPVTAVSADKIVCTLPGGSGTVNVVVSNGKETSVFKRGYRFITGKPE